MTPKATMPIIMVESAFISGLTPRRTAENILIGRVVDDGPDVADMWIADRVKRGDICITGDIPLAAKCLENGGRALRHNGDAFTKANIGNQLAMRDLMNDMRAADPFHQGRGKPFSKADRSNFLNALEREVQAAKREK